MQSFRQNDHVAGDAQREPRSQIGAKVVSKLDTQNVNLLSVRLTSYFEWDR